MAAPTLGPPIEIKLVNGHDIAVDLSWDTFEGMTPVDLDASAVVFDHTGALIDAVYFNQTTALGGSLKHSGDSQDGAAAGIDESITIDLDMLPKGATFVAVIVNAYHGGDFTSVETAHCAVTGTPGIHVGGAGPNTGLILGVIQTGGSAGLYPPDKFQWVIRTVEMPCSGLNFQESMPAIRTVIDALVHPDARAQRPLAMDKTFNMKKGDAAFIPAELFRGGDDLKIGLGWDCQGDIDLDASILIGSEQNGGTALNIVSYQDLRFGSAIVHQGDNQTGEGEGDDEEINCDLDKLPAEVNSLWIVVNCYTGSFADVNNAYVRLVALENGHELARYELHEQLGDSGLVFAKIHRVLNKVGGWDWQLTAIGQGVNTRTATDSTCMAACGISGWLGGSASSSEIEALEDKASTERANNRP